MKYIDSIKDWRHKGLKSYFSGLKLKKYSRKLVGGWLSDVDFMMSWVNSNENQIEIWKETEDTLYEDRIQLYKNLNDFLHTNCRLMMFECDIRVAATHMVLSQDDWECRFSYDEFLRFSMK